MTHDWPRRFARSLFGLISALACDPQPRTSPPIGADLPARDEATDRSPPPSTSPRAPAEHSPIAAAPDPLPAPPFPPLPPAEGRCPPGMTLVPGGRWTAKQRKRLASVGVERQEWDYAKLFALEVADFCLDRTEVTLGTLARCISVGTCKPLEPSTINGKLVPNEQPAAIARLLDGSDAVRWQVSWDELAELPVYWVRAREAIALCHDLGQRLPTTEEWLWAAWGGTQDGSGSSGDRG